MIKVERRQVRKVHRSAFEQMKESSISMDINGILIEMRCGSYNELCNEYSKSSRKLVRIIVDDDFISIGDFRKVIAVVRTENV